MTSSECEERTQLRELVRVLRAEIAGREKRVGVLEEALRGLRCRGTNNIVGTDTRPLGHPCGCNSCVAARMLWPPSNAGVACDTDSGPCACGSWHGIMPMDWARAGKAGPPPVEMTAPTNNTVGVCPYCKHEGHGSLCGYDTCNCPGSKVDRDASVSETIYEEIARLKAADSRHWEWAARKSNEWAATTAKLGRAVSAIERLRSAGHGVRQKCHCYSLMSGPCARCREMLAAEEAGRLILADADSKAAGEAGAELEAVYAAAKAVQTTPFGKTPPLGGLNAALAKVDARRGGGR